MKKDSFEQQAMVKAVLWGDADGLSQMLSRGCSARFKSRDWGQTPWLMAIERAVKKPLEYGPIVELLAPHSDPMMRNDKGYTALQEALRFSGSGLSPKLVKAVLDQGGVDAISVGRAGVLSIACEAGNIECAKMVWDAVKNRCSTEELIMACAASCGQGHLDLFELALGWAKSVNWAGGDDAAVMWKMGKSAIKDGSIEVFHALDRAGIAWTMQDGDQNLLMIAAAASGSADMAEKVSFLSSKMNPSARDRAGWTPLHMAARFCNPEAVEVLIPLSDPGAVDHVGRTALHLASEVLWEGSPKWRQAFKMLVCFCDPGAVDEMGNDALMTAARASAASSVEALLPSSDLSRKNKRGKTAKDYAVDFSKGPHDNVVAKFRDYEFRKSEQEALAAASAVPVAKASPRSPRV